MTRKEHLRWAKDRALEYCDQGDLQNAWASMCSDLRKHDELRDHLAVDLGTLLLMSGHLNTPAKMADYIEGFN